jgi:ribosomal protein S12 methylthiotransferase accessory factor
MVASNPVPLWLRSRAGGDAGYKAHRLGCHRTVSPAATLERVSPLMREMGITRIANVTGLDRIGIPVVMVCRPNSRSIAVSQGKGLDLDAARASGLMEAVETFHAERIPLPLRLGSYDELRAALPLVDVEALPQVSWTRFHGALPLLWIEGHDLIGDKPVWLPYEMVHTNYTLPLPTGSGCFEASTNGLASGNHLLEAALHAICEVVERDSTSLWHALDRPARGATRVDLDTVDDNPCRMMLDRLHDAGLGVAVWETSTDVAVPSFYCLVTDERPEIGHLGAGAGCHPARGIALLRALSEAVQVRMTYITGARDDLLPNEYTTSAIADKLGKARALMGFRAPARNFREIAGLDSETFEDDLVWVLARLRSVGLNEVVAVDLTRPEFGLPVARVVVPGLEAPDDHDGYVPGARAAALREPRS